MRRAGNIQELGARAALILDELACQAACLPYRFVPAAGIARNRIV